jgi:RIO kinase 1
LPVYETAGDDPAAGIAADDEISDAADEDGFGADEGDDEETFVPMQPKLRDRPRLHPEQVAEPDGRERGFVTTYRPSRHEAGWLLSSLGAFHEQELIADVLFLVKGGKEANVYCCTAGIAAGGDDRLLAAKVYRPRQFRNLRNDRMYREGRPILTAEGRAAKASDQRLIRALGKKTDFGVQAQHTSWLMYEYTTLERLHRAGAAVPRAVAAGENAVLMEFIGNREGAAPTLMEASPDPAEAKPLYRQVLRTIEALLREGTVHGDLSAYNILYWQGAATVIDFPQVTGVHSNENARALLERDLTRVCDYFSRLGLPCDAASLARDLWRRFVGA